MTRKSSYKMAPTVKDNNYRQRIQSLLKTYQISYETQKGEMSTPNPRVVLSRFGMRDIYVASKVLDYSDRATILTYSEISTSQQP